MGGGGNNQPFVVYDGSRRHNYEPFNEVCETVQSYYGTGGGNTQLVAEERGKYAGTQDTILRLLFQTYGTKTVIKWGTSILVALQQTEVLQSGMYESCVQIETEDWNKLGDSSLPRPELIAGWVLRDMRKCEKCRRSSQGRKSAEQCSGEFAESMQKLSFENTSSCKDLFDMWSEGKGLWVLRQTLSEIQKIWESIDCERKGGDGMNSVSETVVRRLTPL